MTAFQGLQQENRRHWKIFYHSRNEDAVRKITDILKDADLLLERCGASYDEVTEYQLLVRCLAEQTVVEEAKRRLKIKEDGGMDPGVLQNPSDPEATFREKAGKQQRRIQTEEFRQFARIRNGVEMLPSILRNQYHVDNMFVIGLQKTKLFFGSKIGALNFRKLFRYRRGLGYYAQNPAMA